MYIFMFLMFFGVFYVIKKKNNYNIKKTKNVIKHKNVRLFYISFFTLIYNIDEIYLACNVDRVCLIYNIDEIYLTHKMDLYLL